MCQTLTSPKPADRKEKNQGMNWLSKPKRLAIYLRDGLSCAYCGQTLEDGVKLTLDHLTPYSLGGSNEATNLITCCSQCNSSRGNRPVEQFAEATANYLNHGLMGQDIVNHILDCVARPLDIKAAKDQIARRGWWVKSK